MLRNRAAMLSRRSQRWRNALSLIAPFCNVPWFVNPSLQRVGRNRLIAPLRDRSAMARQFVESAKMAQ